jgi:hypothetical protein
MQIMCKHKILKLIIKYELLTIYRKEESLVELHNYWQNPHSDILPTIWSSEKNENKSCYSSNELE